ncbi:hypothetical protein ACFYVR_16240 [Rhodococcus sp. NPDC003318]|uniref:hypothetical protein n=1 Tax=Rhodococcus sp. NPDC003318 TaxID=3364503 RepID=UPI00369CD421
MKSETKTALAAGVGAGYVLGRTHRMKLALMLAGGALTGRLPTGPGGLMKQATGALGSSTELGRLTESVRGELAGAARAAAVAAAANRIDALSDRLQHRGPASTDPGHADDEKHRRKNRPRRKAPPPAEDREDEFDDDVGYEDDHEPEDDDYDYEDEQDEDEQAGGTGSGRRRTSAERSSGRPRTRARSDEDPEPAPPRRPGRSESRTAARAPVRRRSGRPQ